MIKSMPKQYYHPPQFLRDARGLSYSALVRAIFRTSLLFLCGAIAGCATEAPFVGTSIEERASAEESTRRFIVKVERGLWGKYGYSAETLSPEERKEKWLQTARTIGFQELTRIGRCKNGFSGPDVILGDGRGRYSYFWISCKE